jgi:hypothetical protein
MVLRPSDEKIRVERKICQSMFIIKKNVSLKSRIILFKRLGYFHFEVNTHTHNINGLFSIQARKIQQICQCIIVIRVHTCS